MCARKEHNENDKNAVAIIWMTVFQKTFQEMFR